MILENKPGIYIITCIPTQKSIIGETGNVRKRINYHIQNLKGNRHENLYLQNAWNKYGYYNFSFNVLEYCEFTECKIKENYYCLLYNTHNPEKGFNLRPTGNDLKNKFTEEHKQKIKESLKKSEKFKNRDSGKGMRGKVHSEESRKKISNSNKGKSHSEQTRLKLSIVNKGKTRSEKSVKKQIESRKNNNKPWHTTETREKMSEAAKGRKFSKYSIEKMKLSRYKPIIQYDLEGNFIKEWLGASQVRDKLGYNQSNITGVCNGLRKTHKNFIWKYKQKND
jgi:group I intron endonuclease